MCFPVVTQCGMGPTKLADVKAKEIAEPEDIPNRQLFGVIDSHNRASQTIRFAPASH